jgi:hypothetical protein
LLLGSKQDNRMVSAVAENFVFLQQVLKWLQNPLLKNVALWQPLASAQDLWHAAWVGCLPDEPLMYFSPLVVSHSWLLRKEFFKFFATPLGTAFLFVHGVLKWLHHPWA